MATVEDIEEEDPVVVLFPDHVEIARRQGAGVLNAPAGGAPSRTWVAVVNTLLPHVRNVIDANRFVYDFASPVTWEAAQQAARALTDDHEVQWTQNLHATAPIATALVIFPKAILHIMCNI
eukprot:TRINITY_DN905_c0_g1_i1.p1 TRINITY_DN905_c0_g1~~TRINITY_DN905_c0_g1_i1.p1  ORF type:complete len:121 (+),score=36.59 TRINITY_DN905_c0_g1_i1:33-395(+)